MKQLEERPTYDIYGEASARISISFLTRFTPFTCRVSSAARALRSARGTVPTKVTVPPLGGDEDSRQSARLVSSQLRFHVRRNHTVSGLVRHRVLRRQEASAR